MFQILTAGAMAATAVLGAPAGQAFAAEGPNFVQMRLSGKIAAHDYDGPGDITRTETPFTKNVTLFREGGPRSKIVTIPSQCTGGEVRTELVVSLAYDPANNKVVVNAASALGRGLKLFEGTACDTTDLDGTGQFGTVAFTQPNSFTTVQLSAANGEVGGFDGAVADIRIERLTQ
jgi:hypothetical protein